MLSVKVFESITSMDMFLECLVESAVSQWKAVAYEIVCDIWEREKNLEKREKALELLRKKKELTVLVIDYELSSKSLPFFWAGDLGIVSANSRIVWDDSENGLDEMLKHYLGKQRIEEKDRAKVWDAETMCRYGLANKMVSANTITNETREYLIGMTNALSIEQTVAIKKCFQNYKLKRGMKRKALVDEEMKQFCILSEEQYKELANCDDT